MKAVYIAMMAAAGIVMTGQAHADEALAKAKGCMGCHAVDKKLVGPSYKDIAAKYKGQDTAALVKKVKAGGSGVWGSVPMPASQASEADIKVIVDWIMAR